MDKESMIKEIQDLFSNMSGELDQIRGFILQSPEHFNSGAWAIIQSIYEALLPMGYTLVALFFIIDFLNKSIMFEWVKWENVVKSLLKMVVAKLIIENSFMLLNTIFSVVTEIINKTYRTYEAVEMTGANIDGMIEEVNKMNFIESIGFYMSISPWTTAMEVVKIIIYVIIYGRMIEIYLLTAVAPLPLATLAGDGTQGIAKKFLQVYFSVCLQGVVLLIGTMLYGAMLSSFVSSGEAVEAMKQMVLVSFVLLIIFVKSGSWSRQLTGII